MKSTRISSTRADTFGASGGAMRAGSGASAKNWNAPLYWTQQNGEWRVQRMFDEGLMDGGSIRSWASVGTRRKLTRVLCRNACRPKPNGKRPPSWDAPRRQKRRFSWGDEEPTPALCNFDYQFWGTTAVGSFPEGATPAGALDMTGNVWEWTSSPFTGYPDFKAFPYPEYSADLV